MSLHHLPHDLVAEDAFACLETGVVSPSDGIASMSVPVPSSSLASSSASHELLTAILWITLFRAREVLLIQDSKIQARID